MYIVRPRDEKEWVSHLAQDSRTPFSTICGKFRINFVSDIRKTFGNDVAAMQVCVDCVTRYNAIIKDDVVVVDTQRGRIYSGFKSISDAEDFSMKNSLGAWGVIMLSSPEDVVPDPILEKY